MVPICRSPRPKLTGAVGRSGRLARAGKGSPPSGGCSDGGKPRPAATAEGGNRPYAALDGATRQSRNASGGPPVPSLDFGHPTDTA